MGLPVLRALSLCTCCRHYPGAATGRRRRSSHPAVSAFPDNVVGSTCTLSFSRIAQRSLALRPAHSRGHLYVTCYTEGFSHFVSSMTAPVASGWSVRRVGLAPTGKRRLLTAHANSGHSRTALWDRQSTFPGPSLGQLNAANHAGRPRREIRAFPGFPSRLRGRRLALTNLVDHEGFADSAQRHLPGGRLVVAPAHETRHLGVLHDRLRRQNGGRIG